MTSFICNMKDIKNKKRGNRLYLILDYRNKTKEKRKDAINKRQMEGNRGSGQGTQ